MSEGLTATSSRINCYIAADTIVAIAPHIVPRYITKHRAEVGWYSRKRTDDRQGSSQISWVIK